MENKYPLDIIVEIENKVDVNKVTYNGNCVWPLVRLAIYMKLNSYDKKPLNLLNILDIYIYLRKKSKYILKLLFNKYFVNKYKYYLKSVDRLGSVDMLFFSRNVDYITSKNISYDKIIDPIIGLIKGKYTFLKHGANWKNNGIRYEETMFLSRLEMIGADILHSRKLKKHNKIAGINNILIKYKQITGNSLDLEWIYYYTCKMEVYTSYFIVLLKKIKPKVVFLSCYYYPYAMGLIRACKILNIKSIDIQHGHQCKHPMYLYWMQIPINGYDLLPDYYWVWSNLFKDNIMSSCNENYILHKPIVGGNRWIQFWKSSKEKFLHSENDSNKFIDSLNNYSRIILYTCTGHSMLDDLFDDHVLDVMENSPKEWFWLIRLHPHHHSRIQEVNSYVRNRGIRNYNVKIPTILSLYEVFEYSSCLVNSSSSACIEGLVFNLKVIITGLEGYDVFYDDYIKDGKIMYAPNYESLFDAIKISSTKYINENIIETSNSAANITIDEIMNKKIL